MNDGGLINGDSADQLSSFFRGVRMIEQEDMVGKPICFFAYRILCSSSVYHGLL